MDTSYLCKMITWWCLLPMYHLLLCLQQGAPQLKLMGDHMNKFLLLYQTDVNIMQLLMGAASSMLLFQWELQLVDYII